MSTALGEFRVVVSGYDGRLYKIEDVLSEEQFKRDSEWGCTTRIVEHPQGWVASSKEELRQMLQQMLLACDKPTMTLTRPELIEVGK